MALDLGDITFAGPAMPGPFVRYKLEALLTKKKLLARESKATAKETAERWRVYQRKLRALGEGKEVRVTHHVLEPLVERLGYATIESGDKVSTREGNEDGGSLLRAEDGTTLRAWAVSVGTDLDAPNKRGRAYRFSPSLIAQRVLLAKGERIGLLTDGQELRIVLSDPSGRDSHLAINLARGEGWRGVRDVPDSYRLLRALCQPRGVTAIGDLLDEARTAQTGVTKRLREQARRAVERFIQGLLDAPENREARDAWGDLDEVAKQLWHEGLVLVYRLLFILKLESEADPARGFSFATVSVWRNSYSPSTALADVVNDVVKNGVETGGFLASSLRALFRLFSEGLSSTELQVNPLGGVLFGKEATPLLDSLTWSERAVADLLDALLWTIPDTKRKKGDASLGRERVHYGALDVEDLGRVYEALLELEPGVTREPMCRLRRAKLEVVVPLEQGARYRASTGDGDDAEDETEADEDDGKKTKVVFVEEIPAHRFYLRVGLGRKASGSYYTPHAFVRFLVQETLGPQLAEKSPATNPDPAAILSLKVLDPAMGSGHFLVEACRFLGEALYEACRLCDEQAVESEKKADASKSADERAALHESSLSWWRRVEDLPDPNDELLAYLPSRAAEGEDSGVSQRKALALCRRLVAVHCLYGVDKNPLAVELARVSLWLESYAEGLPLTFLDHRLIQGDSLTGPFFEHLLTFPATGLPIEELHSRGIASRLEGVLSAALSHVTELEASIGKDIADLELKRISKQHLDDALAPLRLLAAAWTGGVMLGGDSDEMGYEELLRAVAGERDADLVVRGKPGLARMIELGREGVPYDLVFPEVFHPDGKTERRGGFSAALGNPPWDAVQPKAKEFYAAFDLRVLDAPTKRERAEVERQVSHDEAVRQLWKSYTDDVERRKRIYDRLCSFINRTANGAPSGATLDVWQPFAERVANLARSHGRVGIVLPSAFHANQSATGLRDFYLRRTRLVSCFSFENQGKRFFDIHASFKFAPIVMERRTEPTESFRCAFYIHEMDWLSTQSGALEYTREFVETTGGDYLSFIELRRQSDVPVAGQCFKSRRHYEELAAECGVRTGEEMHMSKASHRFTPAPPVTSADPRVPDVAADLRTRGYLPLHEGKTFHQFDDRWEAPPRYLIALSDVADKPTWTGPARFYRAAFRAIARSTDERSAIFCLLAPGALFGNSAPVERDPGARRNADALVLVAQANTFAFDWNLRQKGSANVNLFILNGCPVPKLTPSDSKFLAHSALRLSCNHAGYAPLWTEQLGSEWHERPAKGSWPALESPDERWVVRAAIDAVVANAYGLERSQYEHVLGSFSHTSYPDAPKLCLAAFDELIALGSEAYLKKHDPYWDVPLVTELAKPVVELPGVGSDAGLTLSPSDARPKKSRRKQKSARTET